jgi:hypothetical protein
MVTARPVHYDEHGIPIFIHLTGSDRLVVESLEELFFNLGFFVVLPRWFNIFRAMQTIDWTWISYVTKVNDYADLSQPCWGEMVSSPPLYSMQRENGVLCTAAACAIGRRSKTLQAPPNGGIGGALNTTSINWWSLGTEDLMKMFWPLWQPLSEVIVLGLVYVLLNMT